MSIMELGALGEFFGVFALVQYRQGFVDEKYWSYSKPFIEQLARFWRIDGNGLGYPDFRAEFDLPIETDRPYPY